MRFWMTTVLIGAALALTACEAGTGGDAGPSPQGYTMEVRASGADQTFLITAPDGRVAGARAAEGASALMQSERARALAAEPPPAGEEVPEVMSLRLPGFSMDIGASEDDAAGDRGRVNISIGGGEGPNVEVRADEGGPGEADDRAYVRITGADEESVREFIAEAEELSPEVKAQLLSELGLE